MLVSNISTLRKKAGLTQGQLAAHVGVCKQTISNWECGRVKPRRCQYMSLVQVLGRVQDGAAVNILHI